MRASSWQWGPSVKLASLIKTVYQPCGGVINCWGQSNSSAKPCYHSWAIHSKQWALISAFPSHCMRFLHHVNSPVKERHEWKSSAVNCIDPCLYTVFLPYTQRTDARKAWFRPHNKSFNKAYMEIGKQIIKGAHEMGKYCTVHSRGVAR